MSKNMARHLRLKHSKIYRENQQYLESKSRVTTVPRRSTSWLQGSWAKKYCHKVGEGKYQCNVCDAVLSLSRGLFGNMKRHIRSKHPYVYEKEINTPEAESEAVDDNDGDSDEYLSEFIKEVRGTMKEKSDKENSNEEESEAEMEKYVYVDGDKFLVETDPEFEHKIKYLVTKKIAGRKRAKSCFWNFYNVIQPNRFYSCLACNKSIAIFSHSIENLRRHIQMKHKLQYKIMMKYMSEDNEGRASPISFDKYYFDLEDDNLFKCKECGMQISCDGEDQQVLFEHIKDIHPDQIMAYQEEPVESGPEFEVVTTEDTTEEGDMEEVSLSTELPLL